MPVVAGGCVVLGSVLVLLGWFFDRPSWTDWFGTGISTLPNTALAAGLAGTSMVLIARGVPRWGAVLACIAGLFGLATLFEHVTGVNLGIDTLLVVRDWGQSATVAPGRPGPPASLMLAVLGLGLVAVTLGGRGRQVGAAAGLIAAAVSLLSVTGYLYGADRLYSIARLTAISLQTSIGLLVMAIGLLALARSLNPVKNFGRRSAAGVLVSRLTPAIVLIPLGMGWLCLWGEREGLFDSAFGYAIRTLVEILLLALILRWAARMVRAKENALRDRDVQLQRMIEALPSAVYTTDAEGVLTYCNAAAAALAGRPPRIGVDRWCVATRLYRADGAPVPPEEFPMAAALRAGGAVRGEELIAESADGSRVWVEAYPTAIRDDEGRVVGGINMMVDVSTRKETELALARLAAIVESSDDAIVSKGLDGVITTWNAGAERMFGFSAAEAVGRNIKLVIPADRVMEEEDVLRRIRAGEKIEHFETERRTKSGRKIFVSLSVSPLRNRAGKIVGASKVARDITEKKAAEAALADQQRLLEQRVQDRTRDLKAAHERLRLADRMAAVGTLAAGLAHDMKNVLMPLGIHTRAMQHEPGLPSEARKDLHAIAGLLEHLRAMAQNLSLFARDPNHDGVEGRTSLDTWQTQVRGFIDASVGPGVALRWSIPAGLPEVRIAPHRLTQAVLNLVHNARDAILDARRSGTAPSGGGSIVVEADGAGDRVRIRVCDDGCGMSEEVRQRCVDPFFTTKDRQEAVQGSGGTGMGLALALAVAERLGGTLEVESQEGVGTTVQMNLPVAAAEPERESPPRAAGRAWVQIEDRRMKSIVDQVLASLRFDVADGGGSSRAPSDAEVWIVDAARLTPERARQALAEAESRRIIAIDDAPGGTAAGLREAGVHVCLRTSVLSDLRAVLARETPRARGEGRP